MEYEEHPTLYTLIHSLDAVSESYENMDLSVVERGEYLFSLVMEKFFSEEFDLQHADITEIARADLSKEIYYINQLDHEEERMTKVWVESIPIWTKDQKEQAVNVKAAIWKDIPEYYFGYLYARKEGADLTVVPYEIKGKNGADTTRVHISINPKKNKNYTLRPIAEILELMEQMEEYQLYQNEGEFRRDYSHSRDDNHIFGEVPFSATSDPWYIKPEEDVLDAPGVHSLLGYDEILNVLRNNGSAVKKSTIVKIKKKDWGEQQIGESVSPKVEELDSDLPMHKWQELVRTHMKKEEYVVVMAEMDYSLIGHSNKILQALCMRLVEKPFHECKSDQFFFPDYRTCVYADSNCTIVLYVKNESRTSGINPILEGRSDYVIDKVLVKKVATVLEQREFLLWFGNEMKKTYHSNQKFIEKLNERFMDFTVNMQKDDMVSQQAEKELYSFLQNRFEIQDMMDSMTNSIERVLSEFRNKQVAKFNWISAIAVPFVLIATIFQMGIIKFPELFALDKAYTGRGWGIVIAITAALMFIIYRIDNKNKKD